MSGADTTGAQRTAVLEGGSSRSRDIVWFSHSHEDLPQERWHRLFDQHLAAVGEMAAQFAAPYDGADLAREAGRSHDLGKARDAFQRRLSGDPRPAPHAIYGAKYWMDGYPRDDAALALAFLIAGHHAGLHDAQGAGSLQERLAEPIDLSAVVSAIPPGFLSDPPPLPPFLTEGESDRRTSIEKRNRRFEMWLRFVFSALVDADFLDTEAFKRGLNRSTVLAGFDDIPTLRSRLDQYVDRIARDAEPTRVNRIRAEVLTSCREAARIGPGCFSLTVPTGGGKTLSGMAFALRHAEIHGLRRVVVAIPYTSIIEQNAAVYGDALGRGNVLEHHCTFDSEKLSDDETRARHELAAENWDAPIVVTTNVQLFESLFANRTSRCRKLHRLANSVIVLDEIQTLDPQYVPSVLDALRDLVEIYGCSIILSTATQPALESRDGFEGLDEVREIVDSPADLVARLERYEIEWRLEKEERWRDLAAELAGLPQVLCVVHRRSDARELFELARNLDSQFIHLSASMCPKHREEVITEIKKRLHEGRTCRVVATQLVECGVDVDFPVVFRALAGLDSILQAAGRCNREGRPELGKVVVFRAPTEPPPGALRHGKDRFEAMLSLADTGFDATTPEAIQNYFERFYADVAFDRKGIQAHRSRLEFRQVARKLRLVDDSWSLPVVVRWGGGGDLLDQFEDAFAATREDYRALQAFTVNMPRRLVEEGLEKGVFILLHDSVVALSEVHEMAYDSLFGLGPLEDRGRMPLLQC